MISQKYRFHGHGSLRYVFTHGRVAHDKFFMIKWAANERRHHARLSVVVSKKIYKSAVKRNRIRRRIYEVARPLLIGAPAVDVVINVRSTEVLEVSKDELAIQLLPLLREAGLKPPTVH